MSEEQLSLLDIVDVEAEEKIETASEEAIEFNPETEVKIVPYEVGDVVRVNITITPEEDPESYYYLDEFKKEKGKIEEVILEPRLQYRVTFGEKETYLYHKEITWTA